MPGVVFSAQECTAVSSEFTVKVSDEALKSLLRYRHRSGLCPESGGQIFGALESETCWLVECVSGPKPGDMRRRGHFHFDRGASQEEIDRLFSEGLHYLGDWHSHPQPSPEPSARDRTTIGGIVSKSDYELLGLLMLIVGSKRNICSYWLSLHTRTGAEIRLKCYGQLSL